MKTIVSVTTFRSKALVNMTDDMIRVVIDMTRHEWRELQRREDILFLREGNRAGQITKGSTTEVSKA